MDQVYYCGGWVEGAKSFRYQDLADKQTYRTGGTRCIKWAQTVLETELVKFGPISMFGLKHQTRCQRFRKIYECFGEMLHMRSHGRNTQQFTK